MCGGVGGNPPVPVDSITGYRSTTPLNAPQGIQPQAVKSLSGTPNKQGLNITLPNLYTTKIRLKCHTPESVHHKKKA